MLWHGSAGLHGRSEWDNHGPVVAARNQTKFKFADGTPIHVVATTVYGMFLNASVTLPTLRRSPFNKVRTGLWGGWANGELYPNGTAKTAGDPTRFNVSFWQAIEGVLGEMRTAGIHAEIILVSPPGGSHDPQAMSCLGGTDPANYNLTLDQHYIKYVVSRLASYRNVWWSMANEWNQYPCMWDPAAEPTPGPCDAPDIDPAYRLSSQCGRGGSNTPAWHTPVWDALFQTVDDEDPSNHLLSIHNNAYLYNYSQPWVSHFSLQHTHNHPRDLWATYGLKPVMYDEVKYEGRLASNWGSLSANQMVSGNNHP